MPHPLDGKIIGPNEWEIEFSKDLMPDGRILVTCTYCVSQGRTENCAWACINQYWASEAIKAHRQEHFAIPLDKHL